MTPFFCSQRIDLAKTLMTGFYNIYIYIEREREREKVIDYILISITL